MSQMPIELKGGNFTLSVVYLYHKHPDVIHKALQNKIDQAPNFFKNAPVVLNIAALDNDVNWKQIQHAIVSTGLHIVGISGCTNEDLAQKIAYTGLPILSESKKQKKETISQLETSSMSESLAMKPLLVTLPVRSGQQIYARNVDLIVVNNVSAGAELVADGNIHIYGMMRGRALAGANGDRDCQIFCTSLSAELISIAGEYWLMDQIPAEFFAKSARLSLIDGALTIQRLN